jgi:lipopolysaccharide export system protein LptA
MQTISRIVIACLVFQGMVESTFAQVSTGGSGRGFKGSETDAQGRKINIRGEAWQGLSGGRMAFTGMRIEIWRGTNSAMIVEAADGIYDTQSDVTFSTNTLTLRASDGRFSISGVGFRYEWSKSQLIVSNEVKTVIRRSASRPLGFQPPATMTNASPKPEPARSELIEILSDHLDSVSDVTSFSGHVRAKDEQGLLSCGELKAFFEPAGNNVWKIEADQDVVFESGDRRTTAGHAVYLMAEDFVTLTGKPEWKFGETEGSSEILRLDNKTREFAAEQNVRVKLPPRNMLPLDWLDEGSRTNAPDSTNRWITIFADRLNYNPTKAVFHGGVRLSEPQGAEIRAGVMTNFFSGPESQLAAIVLQNNVEFRQGDTFLGSDTATYRTNHDFVTLNGSPRWRTRQGEGRGDEIFINPKARQIHAERNVSMKLVGSGLETLDLAFQSGRTNALVRTNQEFVITAGEVYYRAGSAIFLRGVRVTSPDRPADELTCEVLAAFFMGPENKLDELIAEETVQIRQGELSAAGGKVVYWVPKGLLDVTGRPVLVSPGRKYLGDRFVLNRIDNSFRIIGNYRIELERSAIREKRD